MTLITRGLRDLCIGIASIAIMLQGLAAQQIVTTKSSDVNGIAEPATDKDVSQKQYLITLVDRSSSTGLLSPPETQRAVIKHIIDTASLARQPVELLIICYGGDGVQVFGENGQPTVAYESLLKQVFDKWPAASGGTPMDQTYERLLEIVRDLPDEARTTVVQMTDGIPDSMRLRPESFQAIRDSIALKREAILKKAAGFPASVQQELLRQFEQPLLDPRTKEWLAIYEQQLPLELQRTLEHAVALKKEHVRFVTVDFMNSPQLAEIHATAGGAPEDLIITSPNDIISKLHERKITALPRLVQMPNLVLEADAQAFERETEVPLETIAEAAQIVIELQPATPDFFLNSTLKAEYVGRTFEFNPDAGAAETSVALDGDGGVATLTLKLDDLSPDETVKLKWETSNGNMTAPRCSVYTFLRMKESLKADFRPTFVPGDVQAPFKLSSSNKVAFSFGLQNSDATDIIKVSTVEAVFRNKRGLGKPVRVSMTLDPKHPERVVSDETMLEAGSYDVHLHVRLPSGIDLALVLRGHLDVSLRNEAITVELPFGNEDNDRVSERRSHVDFGPLGDIAMGSTKLVYLRSKDLEYPITIKLDGTLSTTGDVIPTKQWLKFQPTELTLQPGKAVPVKISVELPTDIEAGIGDGPVDGQFTATLIDTDVALPVFRFKPVANVSDEEPVNRLTFDLRRPHVAIRVPYALREWSDGKSAMQLRVDIRSAFSREVNVWVRHSSWLPRTIKVAPAKLFSDRDGKTIPQLRLVPVPGESLVRVIKKDDWACYQFMLESDDDCQTDAAEGLIELYGPGVVSQSVRVKVVSRDPMLEATIYFIVVIITLLVLILASKHLVPYLRERKLTTGKQHLLTPQSGLAGLISLQMLGKNRLSLIPSIELESIDQISGVARRIPAAVPIQVKPEQIEKRPLVFQVPGDEPGVIRITEVAMADGNDPEVRLEIEAGGDFDESARRRYHRILKYAGLSCLACLLLACLQNPTVVRGLQWLHDAAGLS